jgi:hypothetical protein
MMMEAVFVTLLFHFAGLAPRSVAATAALIRQQPDISKASDLGRWPNERDLARLGMAEGKPRWVVLLILGHPNRIDRSREGLETWTYPWCAGCILWFYEDACIATFYTAGY